MKLFAVITSVQHTIPESVANTHVRVPSMSGLFGKERTATDSEFCERFEILLVTTSNCEFLPTFNAETILSRRVRLDLYHERSIHERRSVDPNESVRLHLFSPTARLPRSRANQCGFRGGPKGEAVAIV